MMLSSAVKLTFVFISGVFIPLNDLPAWGRTVALISPLTYFTDAARHLIQDAGSLPMTVDLLALLAFTALFLAVAAGLHARTMTRRI